MGDPNLDSERARILFSGASGMLGTALREAFRAHAEIHQLVRRAPAAPNEITWDPSAACPLASSAAIEGLTAVIHLSGANVGAQRWSPRYKRAMYSSRVTSTRALSEVLSQLARPPQVLVVASAIGIYGDRGDQILTEQSAPGSGFLADLCRAWEAATEPATAAGIRVVHLRLGVVLGQRAGALTKMLPLFRLGLGGRLGSGRQWMSWIALPDVVRAVEFLLRQSSIAGAVNLVAPHPVTNAEFTRALARQVHRPASFRVPKLALRLAFGEMAEETMLASTRAEPVRLMRAGFSFLYPHIDEALRGVLHGSTSGGAKTALV